MDENKKRLINNIIELHESVTGIKPNDREKNNIESIVCCLFNRPDFEKLTFVDMSTIIYNKIIFEHPFLNGNKRTALAMLIFGTNLLQEEDLETRMGMFYQILDSLGREL